MMTSIVIFVAAIAVVLLVLKLLGKSVKLLCGILVNAIIGAVIMFILNALGVGVVFNWIAALIIGLLGIPGLILVAILQLAFHVLI
jgi:inhibitor of the pro-sigma K processing machinery